MKLRIQKDKILMHLILIIVSAASLVPFLILLAASFTEENSLIVDGFTLFPKVFSTTGYRFILNKPQRLISAYQVSLLVTAIGTAFSILFMTMMAYPMSRSKFRLQKFFSLYILIPMLFNGGLVPYYILVTQYLQLRDTFIVLLLPNLIGLYQLILLRTYFKDLPEELFEAARMDGAGEWRILFSIVFQLGKPALATIGLMIGMQFWNNWTTALYFIDSWELYPLQYLLYQVMRDAEALALEPSLGGTPLPLLSTRMAMAVLAAGPAAVAFLFTQKYLIKGITLGSIK